MAAFWKVRGKKTKIGSASDILFSLHHDISLEDGTVSNSLQKTLPREICLHATTGVLCTYVDVDESCSTKS